MIFEYLLEFDPVLFRRRECLTYVLNNSGVATLPAASKLQEYALKLKTLREEIHQEMKPFFNE